MRYYLSLLLLGPLFVFSQKYKVHSLVILKNGDSLQVLTQDKQFQDPYAIKTFDSATRTQRTFRPSEVRALVIGGQDYYTSAFVSIDQTPYHEEVTPDSNTYSSRSDTVFLKTEYFSNAIQLYSFRDNKRTHLFIQKNNGGINELIYINFLINRSGTNYENENKKFIFQLRELLSDCPDAISHINNIDFSVQAIEKVLEDYNRICRKGSATLYKKEYHSKFEISVIAGASFSSLTAKGPANFLAQSNSSLTLQSGAAPIIGLRFNYIPQAFHSHLSALADIYYNSYDASSTAYSNYVNSTFFTKTSTTLKASYARLGIMVRYYFLNEKSAFRPFVNAGYSAEFILTRNNQTSSDNYFNGNQNITTSDPYPNGGYKSSQYGFVAGLGGTYSRFSLEYRYGSYIGFLNYVNNSLSMKTNEVIFSFRFSK